MSQSLEEGRGDGEDPQGPGGASEHETQNLSNGSLPLDRDTQVLAGEGMLAPDVPQIAGDEALGETEPEIEGDEALGETEPEIEGDAPLPAYTPRSGRDKNDKKGASFRNRKPGRAKASAKAGPVAGKDDAVGAVPAKVAKRRRSLVRFMLLAFGIAAIAFAYTYASQQRKAARDDAAPLIPSTSSSEQTVKKGELIRRGVFEATLVDVRGNFVPENPLEHAEAGQKFVAVEFKLTNKEDQAVVLSVKNQFDLKAGKQRFEVSPVATPVPPFPQTMTLAPGQTIQGWLSFKVPAELKKLQLVFNARVPRI